MDTVNNLGRKYLSRMFYCIIILLLVLNTVFFMREKWNSEVSIISLIITVIILWLFILTFKKRNWAKVTLGSILLIVGIFGFIKLGIYLGDLIGLIELSFNATFLSCGLILLSSDNINRYIK